MVLGLLERTAFTVKGNILANTKGLLSYITWYHNLTIFGPSPLRHIAIVRAKLK